MTNININIVNMPKLFLPCFPLSLAWKMSFCDTAERSGEAGITSRWLCLSVAGSVRMVPAACLVAAVTSQLAQRTADVHSQLEQSPVHLSQNQYRSARHCGTQPCLSTTASSLGEEREDPAFCFSIIFSSLLNGLTKGEGIYPATL